MPKTLAGVIRETWPVDVIVEVAVISVLLVAWALGAPWQALVACGLLFGVAAPALGILACWLDSRRG